MANNATFQEGDLVEAVKGESRYTGRITHSVNFIDFSYPLVQIDRLFSTDYLQHAGFTFTVLEKAKEATDATDQ